jgi:RHS repeat-associated protein
MNAKIIGPTLLLLRLASVETRRESGGTYSTTQIAWTNDALHRLLREASSSTLTALNFTNIYVYDLAGNRLWKTNFTSAGTQVTGYTYNANDQLLVESSGSTSFTNKYDANGSVTNRSSTTETNLYSYNLEGRLAGAIIKRTESGQPILQTNKYFYNQSGIRTREEMTGSVNQTNIFLNDPQNLTGFSQVLEELPSVGATPTASYTIGSQVISQKKSGTNSYFMADGHGSTRLLTDTNGVISDRYSYDAYGNALDFTFGTLNPPRTAMLYSAERFDSDLQQYYLRARYYNPAIGRFGVQDQVDGTPNDPLSLHKYAYCQNNPVNARDPSGNETLIGLSFAMSIRIGLDVGYNGAVLLASYRAGAMLTEITEANESLDQIEGQDASPDVDTATILVHGVSPHGQGWSTSKETPFQQNLKISSQNAPKLAPTQPLNHDFYEFDWGGFSVGDLPGTLVPIKSVHEMALAHLQIAEMLVWMKGYNNINIISHSWGTTLTYDLQNTSGIETHDWVTMGSPLKPSTDKPVWIGGDWINCYSLWDPVIHLEIYPPFPSVGEEALGIANAFFMLGFSGDGLTRDSNVDIPHSHYMHSFLIGEHDAYWNNDDVLKDLRTDLQ